MRTLLSAAGILALALTGCPHHHHHPSPPKPKVSHPSPPPHAPAHGHHKVVVVEKTHRCHTGCGHYYRGSTVYYVENHHHGPGCGHRLSGGIYIHID